MKHSSFNSLTQELPPTILTIFGATGDLSADYLLPALLHMEEHKLLPKTFKLVAVGRRDFTAKTYADFIFKKSSTLKKVGAATRAGFLKRLIYFRGEFEKPESFKALAQILSDHDIPKTKGAGHACFNRLFYFATKPQQFADIANILKSQGLLMACGEHGRQARVLVEKPFGFNLKSAQALNHLLLKYFKEEQIYRIDHYVGKETVQNLIVARFGNTIFEPLWNKNYIDHIEISVLYKDQVGERLGFYDEAGAIKDVVQNHILQMLALILMDEPKELTERDIRDEKVKILSALREFQPADFKNLLLGQYAGYQKEAAKISPDKAYKSPTETFAALKAYVDVPRWQDMPIYIRTGKALNQQVTEISVHFKELPRCLFKGCAHNILTFRIQPEESVHLQINNKIPGFGIELHQSDLEFSYHKNFLGEIPSAYERLLLDFMEGDQRLFIRSDEIEAAWRFIDSITESPEFKHRPRYGYKAGSGGPAAVFKWMESEGKEWKVK